MQEHGYDRGDEMIKARIEFEFLFDYIKSHLEGETGQQVVQEEDPSNFGIGAADGARNSGPMNETRLEHSIVRVPEEGNDNGSALSLTSNIMTFFKKIVTQCKHVFGGLFFGGKNGRVTPNETFMTPDDAQQLSYFEIIRKEWETEEYMLEKKIDDIRGSLEGSIQIYSGIVGIPMATYALGQSISDCEEGFLSIRYVVFPYFVGLLVPAFAAFSKLYECAMSCNQLESKKKIIHAELNDVRKRLSSISSVGSVIFTGLVESWFIILEQASKPKIWIRFWIAFNFVAAVLITVMGTVPGVVVEYAIRNKICNGYIVPAEQRLCLT